MVLSDEILSGRVIEKRGIAPVVFQLLFRSAFSERHTIWSILPFINIIPAASVCQGIQLLYSITLVFSFLLFLFFYPDIGIIQAKRFVYFHILLLRQLYYSNNQHAEQSVNIDLASRYTLFP